MRTVNIVTDTLEQSYGSLRTICGPMFSGKTTRLIQAAASLSARVAVLKSAFDDRHAVFEIVSHDNIRIPAIPIASVAHARNATGDASTILIDEVQFLMPPHFEGNFPELVREWLQHGHTVICSGLDMDFEGRPFEVTAALLAMADDVEKCRARCTISGLPASKTARLEARSQRFLIGGASAYAPRANRHWQPSAALSNSPPAA